MNNFHLICSPGGVGHTMFIYWIKKFYSTNHPHDHDGLKHLRQPPIRNDIKKAIYIFSKKPEDQAISLVKRFKHVQIQKLTGKKTPIKKIGDLINYNYDLFDFEGVFKKWWYSENIPYNIAFVNYDNLWDYISSVLDFLELDKSKKSTFPKKKQRTNTLQSIKNNTLLYNHLQNIYEDYKNFMLEIPDFYIKN